MNYLDFIAYMFTTAWSPGPNNIAGMSNAVQHGLKKGIVFNFGIFAGQVSIMFACAAFCNVLSTALPKIEMPLRILGALYILWLAWKIFRSSGDWSEMHTEARFLPGLFLCWLNPKYYFYSIASMEAFVLPYCAGNWGKVFLFAGILSVNGFLATLCWSVCGSAFRKVFTKHGKIVNTILALLLVYCAVRMFL